ncbi:MAG: UvrB/UvrC motif-containing protein [Phycisphaerae bacterium]
MSYIDLRATLADWPYDPEQISVRKIIGIDGTEKLQMRVELGVLQMDTDGRPDGAQPYGCQTLLEYHKNRRDEFIRRNGTEIGFALSPQECEDLRGEASIFYRRFVSYYVLEEFDKVYRDTAHNLELFDLCREHAMEPADRRALEVYRPYVIMMDARSRAHHALDDQEPASALAHVNRGITHLRSFYEDHIQGDLEDIEEQSNELRILRDFAKEINAQIPEDSVVVTRRALRTAIEEERFEEAAKLRDALQKLGEGLTPPLS